MHDPTSALNIPLEREAPALLAALSPLGRRAFFPPDIPAQAAEARGKEINGTIGQITDGRGGALGLPALAAAFGGLSREDLNQALLYSPIEGIAEVRRRWRQWQRRGVSPAVPSSLPLVTVGLSHGLSLVADLFGGEGKDAKRREGGMRFQSVAKAERQELAVRSREVQKGREERRTIETRISAPTPSRPGEAIQPATAQLPKSPIVAKAASRMGRNQAPPAVPQAPQPDLKRQPKAEPTTRPQNVERNQPQPEVRQPEPGKQLPPGRSQTTPRERPVQPEAQPRPPRERESRPDAVPERTPRGLDKKAPPQSEPRRDDSAARAREESERNIRAQEQQAQQESESRSKEATAKAAEESQRKNAPSLERKVQQDSEQRAADAARAREESQRNIRAQQQQAQQQESERRARDAAVKAREDSQRNARSVERQTPPPQPRANPPGKIGGPDQQQVQPPQQQPPRVSESPRGRPPTSEKGATKLREYDRQKEGKGKP